MCVCFLLFIYLLIYLFVYLCIYLPTVQTVQHKAAAEVSKIGNRKPIGEVGCCESRMAERIHWWTDKWLELCFFPTCQVRVVRFYVSCLLLSSSPLLLLLLNRDPRRTVFSVGPQPRPSTPSVPCRTSTTTIPAQCSLPDLNHDHPRPVFPAGPQPRVSTPSVPCRTSCRKIWDKECAEES